MLETSIMNMPMNEEEMMLVEVNEVIFSKEDKGERNGLAREHCNKNRKPKISSLVSCVKQIFWYSYKKNNKNQDSANMAIDFQL